MSLPRSSSLWRYLSTGVVLLVCLVFAVQAVRRQGQRVPEQPGGEAQRLSGQDGARLLGRLAEELPAAVAASREVLIGRRDPDGPSCVTFRGAVQRTGSAPLERVEADPAGGPATRLAAVWGASPRDARCSVRRSLKWYQTAVRAALRELAARNEAAWERVRPVCGAGRRLAAGIGGWQQLPDGWHAEEASSATGWPGACLERLCTAAAAGDLPACRRWADELAAALFALDDLHRWLQVLLEAQLASMDFQRDCGPLFDWAESVYGRRYSAAHFQDRFPSFVAMSATMTNLAEVERQAQDLFRCPCGWAEAASSYVPWTPAAVWVPPDLRQAFEALRSCLSPANQAAWDQAASMPFERSYLTNMLFRAAKAQMVTKVGRVLRRFDRVRPEASAPELMDVLFHRAGAITSGLEWADRYHRRLMWPGGQIPTDPEQLLRKAHRLTHRFLGGWGNYAWASTLREALARRKLDCVRGSDMIGALYRNAGGSGYFAVHVNCGTAGHSLSAAEIPHEGGGRILLADSLVAGKASGRWPAAFFRGMDWPAGYPGTRGPAYAAELFARGLDSYVFAEGYVIRGPNAGLLVRTALPYVPGRDAAARAKVYAGPYPLCPTVGRLSSAAGPVLPGPRPGR